MPYIEQSRRAQIYDPFKQIIEFDKIKTPGELNYAITMMLKHYCDVKGHSYTNYNEVVGVLECAKLEFYRRKAAPYEDTKIVSNGDVY